MKSQRQLSFSGNLLGLLVFLLASYSLQAQGIKGKVVDISGEPLPFASIGVMGTSQGVASNVEGEYILALAPGKHKIRFQYLGYTPIDTTFTIGSSYTSFRAVMRPEVVALPEAVVSGNGEDPAGLVL